MRTECQPPPPKRANRAKLTERARQARQASDGKTAAAQGKGMRTGADVLHWTGFDKTTVRASVKTQVGLGRWFGELYWKGTKAVRGRAFVAALVNG